MKHPAPPTALPHQGSAGETDASSEAEIPLSGGRVTLGVVRLGNTVRRPRKPNSPFIADLLLHLEAVGYEHSPRFLGSDSEGRDCFSIVPGVVPEKWQLQPDHAVRRAGELVRAFHDATAGSTLAARCPVVCHNDLGPNNFVFQGSSPVALIDFDLAKPGTRLEDLGYMAWAWCVSSKQERLPFENQAHQIRLLANSYGLSSNERVALPQAILDAQTRNIRYWAEGRDRSEIYVEPDRIRAIIEWSERERAFVELHKVTLRHALQ